MMSKSEIEKMINKIEAAMKRVAEERDKIDDLILELEQLEDNCRTAHDLMYDARDALSELV